tara:strand:+ start:425 stop:631 length:207 start_codon:yes stop_codon:yes gene_type:complete
MLEILWDTFVLFVLINFFAVVFFPDAIGLSKGWEWKDIKPFILIQMIVILLVIGFFTVWFIWWYIGSS